MVNTLVLKSPLIVLMELELFDTGLLGSFVPVEIIEAGRKRAGNR
jgi:hypothetical protein